MREKIIVAIHGMGDQVRCETIQLVVRQFARYYGVAEGVPLGHLNAALIPMKGDPPPIELEVRKDPQSGLDVKLVRAAAAAPGVGVFLLTSPPFSGETPIGFAEVYWADIPRTVAKDRYNLEAAKKWAATLVERVRAMAADRRKALKAAHAQAIKGANDQEARKLKRKEGALPDDADFDLAADVIGEMIETVSVLEVLLYLLDKVGLLTFDLDQILVDYLGDVQVVAEFDNYRKKIIEVFHTVMAMVHKLRPNADIYIVAHSEGTVVAFLGILEALSQLPAQKTETGEAPPSPWVERLRGLMTIGSPLNKHVLLWPDLWEKLTPPPIRPKERIHWVNYFDYGDPVGFRLSRTRQWMEEEDHNWMPFFQFDSNPKKDDIGFTRYWFAGKAHIDYWKDHELFGHFLYTVVDAQDRLEKEKASAEKTEAEKAEAAERFRDRPNRLWARVFSPHLPYLWAALFLFAGVFALYKGIVEYTLPFAEPAWHVVRNVLGIGMVLAGVTAAVRIPRLTKHVGWRLSGFAFFVVGLLLFPVILTPGAKFRLGSVFLVGKGTVFGNALIAWLNGVAEPLPTWLNITGPTFGILAFALAATLLIYVVSWIRPRWGVYPLIIPGAAVVLGVAGVRMFDAGANEKFAEARAVLARSGLKENRLDEASADLIDRYVSDPNASAGCTDTLADCKAFVTFVADKSPGLLGEDAYKDDVRPRESANADGMRKNASAASTGAASASRPLWPVIVAGAIFLCLWWLAAHVFDLIVVWQHYIRSSAILDRLNEMRAESPSAPRD